MSEKWWRKWVGVLRGDSSGAVEEQMPDQPQRKPVDPRYVDKLGKVVFREEAGVIRRPYESYEGYLVHQASRVESMDLTQYDREFGALLSDRLQVSGVLRSGMSVVCLGARQGTEVRAFIRLGCFAVGIDLKPLDPVYVLRGDFQHLQFADNSVDVAFSNSLDHAFDLSLLLREVVRVLRKDGIMMVDAVNGCEEGVRAGSYESLLWKKIDDLVAIAAGEGLALIHRSGFERPWAGEHLVLRKSV